MPATRIDNPSTEILDLVLGPLIDAHWNGHLGDSMVEFAKQLFDEGTVNTRLEEGKEEQRAMAAQVQNGGFGQTVVCMSVCRAWHFLTTVGQDGNADSLREVAVQQFGEDMVADKCVEVMVGR